MELASLKRFFLAGEIDQGFADHLKRLILADRVVDQEEIELLIKLNTQAVSVHPAFTEFLHAVLRRRLLKDGRIDPPEVAWLRRFLLADRVANSTEVAFLKGLVGQAQFVCPEYVHLIEECERSGLRPARG